MRKKVKRNVTNRIALSRVRKQACASIEQIQQSKESLMKWRMAEEQLKSDAKEKEDSGIEGIRSGAC